jgi:predicted phosphoadenosine phosphosulfate sulfurtransferase
MGWIRENCFVYLLLPVAKSDAQMQTELDWFTYEPSKATEENLPGSINHQLNFFDELERLITQKNFDYENI